MPQGDMVFIVKYQYIDAFGATTLNTWFKRVSTGREGIELRDRIVSTGTRADDRVVVTECKCIPLENESERAA